MDMDFSVEKMNEIFLTIKNGEIYHSVIGTIERMLIEKALERSYGNQILASKILGINRNTLRTKIKKLNISVGRFKI